MFKLADWVQSIEPSAIQRAITLSQQPDFISFALGLPANDFFPSNLINAGIDSTLNNTKFLQYSPPSIELKKHIVTLMRQRGVECTEDQVFLTAGAQQAMSLLTRLLLNTGDSVIVEELAYPGFIQAIKPFHSNILTIPTSYIKGIDINALVSTLERTKPSLMYLVTNGHNPIGLSLSEETKQNIINIIKEFKIPVIEDDTYGTLYYEQQLSPLRALNSEHIIYIGSFSKNIIPTLRVGWIIAPEQLTAKLSIIKEATDINTSTFTQGLVSSFIENGHFETHLDFIRHEYKSRRDKMIQCINSYFPQGTKYHIPNNGVFIWVQLPNNINAQELLNIAFNNKVAFVPGNAFSVSNNLIGQDCIRLNFSFCNEDKIEEGMKRLAKSINELIY